MTPTPLHLHQLRRDHMRVLVQVVEYVQQQLSDPAVLDAASGWFRARLRSGAALESLLVERGADVEFYPWLAWDAPLDRGPLGLQIAGQFSAARDRRIVQALLSSPPQAYRVVRVVEDGAVLAPLSRSAAVRELLVREPVLAKLAPVGELLVARLPCVEGVHLMDAVHATLPARCQRAMALAQARAETLPRADQLRCLLAAARRAVARLQPLPVAPMAERNRRTTLVFAVGDRSAAQRALLQRVAAGELQPLSPQSFAVAAGIDAPAGAVLRLHGARLHASTVQCERVAELQAAVARWMPEAPLQMTLHRDLGPLFEVRTGALGDAEQWRRLASDWLCEVLAGFSETPQPGLGGATPKQLMRTAKGRKSVRAWFKLAAQVAALAEPRYRTLLERVSAELLQA